MYTGLSSPLTIKGLDNVSDSDMDYSVTRYEYGRYSNLISMTDPLNQTETYTYDINGNQLTKTDRNGSVETHVYDGVGRVINTAVATTDGEGNVSVTKNLICAVDKWCDTIESKLYL